MIGLESQPKQKQGILTQQASDTAILLRLDNGEYFALNEVGARVWELCDGSRSVAQVIDLISQEYEAPTETIEADVLELLDELANESLVVADG